MSQGDVFGHTDSIEAFKRIFVVCPKVDFFPWGKSTVFGQK